MLYLAFGGNLIALLLISYVTWRQCRSLTARAFHAGWCAGGHATASILRHQLAARGIAVEFASAPVFDEGKSN